MRRKDKEKPRDWALNQLEKGLYGVLSILDTKDRPYGVPLNYAYKDGYLYFHGAKEGMKANSMNREVLASFTLVTQEEVVAKKFTSNYQSVICFGKIKPLEGPSQKKKALRLLIDKYAKDFLEEGYAYVDRAIEKTQVYEFKIEEMTGKLSQA